MFSVSVVIVRIFSFGSVHRGAILVAEDCFYQGSVVFIQIEQQDLQSVATRDQLDFLDECYCGGCGGVETVRIFDQGSRATDSLIADIQQILAPVERVKSNSS